MQRRLLSTYQTNGHSLLKVAWPATISISNWVVIVIGSLASDDAFSQEGQPSILVSPHDIQGIKANRQSEMKDTEKSFSLKMRFLWNRSFRFKTTRLLVKKWTSKFINFLLCHLRALLCILAKNVHPCRKIYIHIYLKKYCNCKIHTYYSNVKKNRP